MKSKLKILCGAGQYGKRALEFFGEDNVFCFCDSNTTQEGMIKRIITYDELKEIHEDYDVVISVKKEEYCKEIMNMLTINGIKFTLFADALKNSYEQGVESAFTTVYKTHLWGGGQEEYYSGSGSHLPEIIVPYISWLNNFIELNSIESIVEVGCGDFNIMRTVLETNPYVSYYGVDVVEGLIERNQKLFGRANVKFDCVDACKEELPKADLIIIRQVLQHLDNARVSNVLSQIGKYKFAAITEHIYEGADVKYNLDKTLNEGIRLEQKSGVFIEFSPYNIEHLVHVVKVPSMGGVIRTSLVIL